jgi:hypothetical protein
MNAEVNPKTRGRRASLFGDDSEDEKRQGGRNKGSVENGNGDKPSSILKTTSQFDDDLQSFTRPNEKSKVAFAGDSTSPEDPDGSQNTKLRKANLIIRPQDESRIPQSLKKAAKKQATGAIFSVVVDISKNGTLDVGVKDLAENLLVVSMLKRANEKLGAAEEAGIYFPSINRRKRVLLK